jgi:hypothetical protein
LWELIDEIHNTYHLKLYKMRQTSKIIYKTDKGLVFKTIAPVSEMLAFDYMRANYNDIQILSIRRSVKAGYKKACNIRVK